MSETAVNHPQGEVITVSRLGHTFEASRRTVAHLDWTIRRLRWRAPWARLVILQTCYHAGYRLSAGTHDKDCAFDFMIIGMRWPRGQSFLRNAGWAADWRHTGPWADPGSWHYHAISIPPGLAGRTLTPEQALAGFTAVGIVVGSYIPTQVSAYFQRAFGLVGENTPGSDHSYFPGNINKTIYVYNPKDVAA